MMRELELLPVWKLRASPTSVQPPKNEQLAVEPLQIIEPLAEQTFVQPHAEIKPNAIAIANDIDENFKDLNTSYKIIVSDDNKWAFVYTNSPNFSDTQDALFNNILLALNISKTHVAQTQDIANIGVSVVVLMGEVTAQLILNTKQTLETLRGNIHMLHGLPFIVTYHPQDVLLHLPNKAKTWDDLCIAANSLNA